MTRSDPSSQTYHEDFYVWTREQAAALRRCAARLPTDVDIEHCAEEIEDLGKRDLLSTSFDLDDALSRIKSGPDGTIAGR